MITNFGRGCSIRGGALAIVVALISGVHWALH